MADDKTRRGSRDRATVAAGEPYEVAYFAERHGLTRDAVEALIARVGNTRAALDAAVAEAEAPAPKRRRAPAKAAAPKPKQPARRPARPTLAGTAAAATESVQAAVEPVADLAAPVVRKVAAAGRAATSATRRGTAAVRRTAARAPQAATTRANAAADAVRAAATGRGAALVGAAAAGLVTGLALNLGRKVVAQELAAPAGDWFDVVKVEHRAALDLFGRLQAAGDTGRRQTLLAQLKHALEKHAFTEEAVLYPALRAWGDTADADKLHHDHGYVKQYLYDLEGLDDATPAFADKLSAFRAELEAHVREEEEAIFPPLHAALGEAGNAKVTARANREGVKLA